jgi:hypothetical protein
MATVVMVEAVIVLLVVIMVIVLVNIRDRFGRIAGRVGAGSTFDHRRELMAW